MAIACRISRNDINDNIDVRAENGRKSELYKSILSQLNKVREESDRKYNDLKLLYKPWVAKKFIKNVTNINELALGLYKQTTSPNFKAFYNWNFDANNEPILNSEVIDYLFNGIGRNGVDVGSLQDIANMPTILSTPTMAQDSKISQIKDIQNNFKGDNYDGQPIAYNTVQDAENQINNRLVAGRINVNEADKILANLRDENSETKKQVDDSLNKLINTDGSINYNATSTSPIFSYIKEKLSDYPSNARVLKNQSFYSNATGVKTNADIFVLYDVDGVPTIDILNFKNRNITDISDNKISGYEKSLYVSEINKLRRNLLQSGFDNANIGTIAAIPVRNTNGNLEIGDPDTLNEVDKNLRPIYGYAQKTGNGVVNEVISKLASYLSNIQATVTPNSDDFLKETATRIAGAIQTLQNEEVAKPYMAIVKSTIEQAQTIVNNYDNVYADVDLTNTDWEDINPIMQQFMTVKQGLSVFLDMAPIFQTSNEDLGVGVGTVAKNVKDATELLKKVNTSSAAYMQKLVEQKLGIEDLLEAQKVLSGLSYNMTKSSSIANKSINVFSSIMSRLDNARKTDQMKELSKIQDLQKRLKEAGVSSDAIKKVILNKDGTNLVEKISSTFKSEISKAVQDKDYTKILNSINKQKYTDEIERMKQEDLDDLQSYTSLSPERLQELTDEINRNYDLSSNTSSGWFKYPTIMSSLKESVGVSDEWNNLNNSNNSLAKEVYDYIVNLNTFGENIGYLADSDMVSSFFPLVSGGSNKFSEYIKEGNLGKAVGSVVESFERSISADNDSLYSGKVDPISNLPVNRVPKYFTVRLDPSKLEGDIFNSLSAYGAALHNYNYLSKYEPMVLMLQDVTRNLQSIKADRFGNILNSDGEKISPEDGNSRNADELMYRIQKEFYKIKYPKSASYDISLGNLNKINNNINEFLDTKLLPTNLKDISVMKIMEGMSTMFKLRGVGGNIMPALSNYIGGNMQAIINAGTYFNKQEFMKSKYQLLNMRVDRGSEDAKLYEAAINYFLPFTEDAVQKRMAQIRGKGFNKETINTALYYMLSSGDNNVQATIFRSILNNMIVVDGKLQNAYEYTKSLPQYKEITSISETERKERIKNIDDEVKNIISTNGWQKFAKLDENGELQFDGIERDSDSVRHIQAIARSSSASALGVLGANQSRGYEHNFWLSKMMIFRSWIPESVQSRFGNLGFDSEVQAMRYGRFRNVTDLISARLGKAFADFGSIYTYGDRGADAITELYQKQNEKYRRKYGKDMPIDESDFYFMVSQNIRNSVSDLLSLFGLIAVGFTAAKLAPDDEEDPRTKNSINFMLKALDKAKGELMFYYSPQSALELIGGSVIPSIGIISDAVRIFNNTRKEIVARIEGDEDTAERNKVLKYILRYFPVTAPIAAWLPVFTPEIAKELGISSNPTVNYSAK